MRLKKSIVNSSVAIITYFITFLPTLLVRKVFVDSLGGELLGLSSLYSNIIGYLSIIELGIGSAIIYSLYKPFAKGDKVKIKGYLNFYESFYKKIGIIFLVIGLIMTPFVNLFMKDNLDLSLVRISFVLFLLNSAIGYFFTYKQCILTVAQEGYKISIVLAIAKLLIAIFQCVILVVFKSFYGYIIIQIIINLLSYIVINLYIDKKYSWINTVKGDIESGEKKTLIKNIKALFCHKIGSVFVFGTDSIVVASFINLTAVAIYNNYLLIINAIASVVGQAMNGLNASLGNLVAEEDKEKVFDIHKKFFFLNFWIASLIIIILWNTINPFVQIWVGKEYLLDGLTVAVLLFNLYFQMMRNQIEKFKDVSGEYYRDRYAPLVEGTINLIASIALAKVMGLPGVFIGTMISNILVIFWTHPYIVYRYVFEKPLIVYFKIYFKYLFIGIIVLILTNFVRVNFLNSVNFLTIVLNGIVDLIIVNGIYLILFWRTSEFKYYKNILENMITTIRNKKSMKG
ncbi:MAG: lipopolysaccharide biosynthesis protein [Clostridium sp.]